MSAAELTARINAIRAAEGIDSSRGDEWQTLAGPCDTAYLTGKTRPHLVKRQCSRCLTWKVLTEGFSRHPTSSAGHLAMCKTCVNEQRHHRRQRAAYERRTVAS